MTGSVEGRVEPVHGRVGIGLGRLLPSVSTSPIGVRRLLVGFAAVVVATTWAVAGLVAYDARRVAFAEARAELLGAQHTMRAHAERTFEIAQILMTTIDAWLSGSPSSGPGDRYEDIVAAVARLHALNPGRPEVRLFDSAGWVLAPDGRRSSVYSGDREFIRALRDAEPGMLHIGLPVIGRISGTPLVPVSMKVRPNRFGVTFLTTGIAVDRFEEAYVKLLITAPAVYGLLRADSHILLQVPGPPKLYGQRLSSLDLQRLRETMGTIGVVEHDRLGNGPGQRLSGFAFLERYPVMVYASFLKADVDARWHGTAWIAAAIASLATLVVALFTFASLRLLARYAAESDLVRRALAQAEAASRAKSSFMGRMSHEFRTPLNAILGFSEIIRDGYLGPLPDAYREYGADIQQSGRHLLGLVDQILDIAGIEAGTAALRVSVTDVHTMVADAVEAIGPEAAERDVKIRIEPASARVELLVDRRMAMQAVLSILSNAVRASPPGETVVAVVRYTAEGVQVAIADRGPGISAAVREHLFEPFGRHRADIADHRQGLGLGLLVARSFMEIHGGTIRIEPAADQGTVVTLTFPPERVATAEP